MRCVWLPWFLSPDCVLFLFQRHEGTSARRHEGERPRGTPFVPTCLRASASFNDRENVFLAHDHQLFAVELDFGARVGREDDFVALLHAERGALAVVETLAVADAEHFAAL